MEYATVLDILISPIAILIKDIKIPIILLILGVFIWLYVKNVGKWHNKLRNKKCYKLITNIERADKIYAKGNHIEGMVFLFVLMIMFFLLGQAIGAGQKRAALLKNNKLEMRETIIYISQKTDTVRIIRQNSGSVFFAKKGEKKISISPINGNIQTINKLTQK